MVLREEGLEEEREEEVRSSRESGDRWVVWEEEGGRRSERMKTKRSRREWVISGEDIVCFEAREGKESQLSTRLFLSSLCSPLLSSFKAKLKKDVPSNPPTVALNLPSHPPSLPSTSASATHPARSVPTGSLFSSAESGAGREEGKEPRREAR